MVPTSRFVLRGALAVGVAVLASSLSGTIAVAQQVAVNTEDQAASEPSLDEEQSARPMPGRSCLSIRARRPEQSSSILASAISISSSRTIWPSATASASDVSVSNGRASSGCPKNRSGRTGAPRRKWSDGSPICPASWRAVPAIPSAREPSISVTASSASMERTNRRRSGTPFHRDAFVSITPT
jgi:hypothetical protein